MPLSSEWIMLWRKSVAAMVASSEWGLSLYMCNGAFLSLKGVCAALLLVCALVVVALNAGRNHTVVGGIVSYGTATRVLDERVFFWCWVVATVDALEGVVEVFCASKCSDWSHSSSPSSPSLTGGKTDRVSGSYDKSKDESWLHGVLLDWSREVKAKF